MDDRCLDFGRCFQCGRLMPMRARNKAGRERRLLEQIRYYEGHEHPGTYHHKLICLSCRRKARELVGPILAEESEL